MDPFTHAILGGAVAAAVSHHHLGRKAIAVGVLAAVVPDVDFFYRVDDWSIWRHHRGITHSIAFFVVVGPLIGLALRRLFEAKSTAPPGIWPYILAATAALASHSGLDLFTSYGTQLLAPFSDRRFVIPAIAVIDPLYTVPLLAALVYVMARRRPPARARAVLGAVLILTGGYIGYTWHLNDWAAGRARAQLRAEGVAGMAVEAYPTIFQSFLRRVVARDGTEVRIGFISRLNPRTIDWRRWPIEAGPAIAALKQREEGELLRWFASGQVYYRVRALDGGLVVEGHDLRYGGPERSQLGLWGIRARIDAAGRLVSTPRRFRDQPALDGANLGRLWAGVFGGASNNF